MARVTASTSPEHTASWRVMQKCGMTFVREYMPTDPDEPPGLAVEYAITRDEWERQQAAG